MVCFRYWFAEYRVGEMVQFLNKSKGIYGMALNLETDRLVLLSLVMIRNFPR
jgi:hypothetical protein